MKAQKKKAKKKVAAKGAGKVAGKDGAKDAGKVVAKDAGKGGSKRESAKHSNAKHSKIRVPAPVRKRDAGGTVAGAELDPFEVAKQRVKGSVPAIVDAMVEKAKQGSCTHAKTLLEMTGAKHMFDGEGEGQNTGEPWAKLVLERLDEADARGERESAGSQRRKLEWSSKAVTGKDRAGAGFDKGER